ncbi:hypothetical protein ADL03_20470 [Nocardia sp. NRRL S-836]|nr:hypothetical protein ADL03_20470 [Nocardia sp. NRRL S-836]
MDMIAWTNDLYSLNKEEAGGMVTNLILVVEHEHKLDRSRAIDEVRALIDSKVKRFLELRESLSSKQDTHAFELTTQVSGLCDWIAGCQQWHHNVTHRYLPPPASD